MKRTLFPPKKANGQARRATAPRTTCSTRRTRRSTSARPTKKDETRPKRRRSTRGAPNAHAASSTHENKGRKKNLYGTTSPPRPAAVRRARHPRRRRARRTERDARRPTTTRRRARRRTRNAAPKYPAGATPYRKRSTESRRRVDIAVDAPRGNDEEDAALDKRAPDEEGRDASNEREGKRRAKEAAPDAEEA